MAARSPDRIPSGHIIPQRCVSDSISRFSLTTCVFVCVFVENGAPTFHSSRVKACGKYANPVKGVQLESPQEALWHGGCFPQNFPHFPNGNTFKLYGGCVTPPHGSRGGRNGHASVRVLPREQDRGQLGTRSRAEANCFTREWRRPPSN